MVRVGIYCRQCFHLLGLGADGGPCGGVEWVAKCDRCVEHEQKAEAEEMRRFELWRPRVCDADGCDVVFVPRKGGQRFCTEKHRKQHHRRAKAETLALSG
jgi:hypothetical protein